jgi:hypothetical protein
MVDGCGGQGQRTTPRFHDFVRCRYLADAPLPEAGITMILLPEPEAD